MGLPEMCEIAYVFNLLHASLAAEQGDLLDDRLHLVEPGGAGGQPLQQGHERGRPHPPRDHQELHLPGE